MDNNLGNSNAENMKVVLIGESGVGKTSIISRFCHNKFDNVFMPTPGASFISKPLYIDEYDKIIKYEVHFHNL
jgi:GTPase SAR1 family protein